MMNKLIKLTKLTTLTILMILLPSYSLVINSINGNARRIVNSNETNNPLRINERLNNIGDGIHTLNNSNVLASFIGLEGKIKVSPNTIIEKVSNNDLKIKRGYANIILDSLRNNDRDFNIITPGVVGAVRGTEINVIVHEDNRSSIGVTEGNIVIEKDGNEYKVEEGYKLYVDNDSSEVTVSKIEDRLYLRIYQYELLGKNQIQIKGQTDKDNYLYTSKGGVYIDKYGDFSTVLEVGDSITLVGLSGKSIVYTSYYS